MAEQCTGALDNGRIFDGTEDQPLVFTMGERGAFPALERAASVMGRTEIMFSFFLCAGVLKWSKKIIFVL